MQVAIEGEVTRRLLYSMKCGLIDDGKCSSCVDFHLNWGVIDVKDDGEWRRTFIMNSVKTVFVIIRT